MCLNMYYTLVLFLTFGTANGIICNEIKMSDIKKPKLYDLQSLPPQDVIDCLSHLGKEKMTYSEAKFIWNTIIDFYSGIPNIPEDTLEALHWVTIAIQPEDYENMTLGTVDVITNFGYDYGLSNEQLQAIAERVRTDFGAKHPEDYTSYDLVALRQILCVFNKSDIECIHPKAYKEASFIIGQLNDCNFEVLQGFANLSLHKKAFGPPDNWTKNTINSIGIVAVHLPEEIKMTLKNKLGTEIYNKKSMSDIYN